MVSTACRKCGGPIERAEGRGRPRKFCTLGCRRAAEKEIRRIDRQIEATEERLYFVRINGDREPAAARYELERVRLEARLHKLLDDDGVGS